MTYIDIELFKRLIKAKIAEINRGDISTLLHRLRPPPNQDVPLTFRATQLTNELHSKKWN